MSTPYIVTCKDCFRADEVTVEEDHLTHEWVYTCAAHDPEPFVWRVPAPTAATARKYRDTTFDQLGVYDVLEKCIEPGDPWLEYGVVEDRFRRRDPRLYAQLVRDYSHTARDARHGGTEHGVTRTRTTSNRLAIALGVLADQGLFEYRFGPATGFWSYNNQVSYWASSPTPPADEVLTWAQHAADRSLDPAGWKLAAATA